VTGTQIAANAVGTSEVVDDSLTASDLAANSVGTSELAADSVTAAKIAANAVGADELDEAGSYIVAGLEVTGTFKVDCAHTTDCGALLGANSGTLAGPGNAGEAIIGMSNGVGLSAILFGEGAPSKVIRLVDLTGGTISLTSAQLRGLITDEVGTGVAVFRGSDALDATDIAANGVGSSEIAANAVGASELVDGSIGFVEIDNSATVAGNPALAANQAFFGDGGIIFEGSTADAIETRLVVTDPTSSDKTLTLPNATGTVALVADINPTNMRAGWETADIRDANPSEPGTISGGIQEAATRCSSGSNCIVQLRCNTTYTLGTKSSWPSGIAVNLSSNVWVRGCGTSSVVRYNQNSGEHGRQHLHPRVEHPSE